MVKLIAEYIDIPIQEISRLIARRLVNVLDPELEVRQWNEDEEGRLL